MRFLTVLLFSLFCPSLDLSAQLYGDWLGTVDGRIEHLLTSSRGTVYSIGTFDNRADLHPNNSKKSFRGYRLAGRGIFIGEFDKAGNEKWLAFINSDRSIVEDAILDSEENIILTGRYLGDPDWDPDTGVVKLGLETNNRMFVLKLSSKGKFIWAGKWHAHGRSVCVDQNDNMYVTGVSNSLATDLDPGPGKDIRVGKNYGNRECPFLLKLDKSGNYQWGKYWGGSSLNVFKAKFFKGNKILILGRHFQKLDLNPDSGVALVNCPQGWESYFMVMDTNGTFNWVERFGDTLNGDISADFNVFDWNLGSNGEILIYGRSVPVYGHTNSWSYADLGLGPKRKLVPASYTDRIAVALDTNFDYKWHKIVGEAVSPSWLNGFGIRVDDSSNVYVYDTYDKAFDVDLSQNTNMLDSTPNSEKAFLIRLDSTGKFEWGFGLNPQDTGLSFKQANSEINGIVNLDSGNFLLCGRVQGLSEIFGQKIDTSYFYSYFSENCSSPSWLNKLEVCDSVRLGSGRSITQSGLYIDSLTNRHGCDSILKSDVFVKKGYFGSKNVNGCYEYFLPGSQKLIDRTGIYRDTLKNVAGCDSITQHNVTITKIDTLVYAKGPVLVSAHSQSGSFQWLDCNSNLSPLPGWSWKHLTNSIGGEFAVEIRENGCIDTSSCYTLLPSGIEEETAVPMEVYPNPTSGKVIIQGSGNERIERIELTDLNGKILYQNGLIPTEKYEFEMSELKGLYFLHVTLSTGEYETIKLLYY